MDTNASHDDSLADLLGDMPGQDGPVDLIYPVGFLTEGAGPNGELVRWSTPDEARVLSAPLDDIVRLLNLPLPEVTVERLLSKSGVPNSVLDELLNEKWLVRIRAEELLDASALAGFRLLPNISTAEPRVEAGEYVLTSATSGDQVTVLAPIVGVLHEANHDVPSAVNAAAAAVGMDAERLGGMVMEALADLLVADVAYLSESAR